ncbi:Lsr2 family DNA-binding protein [Streptomonospora litoralis]|uniref:Lsr2 DNA-binding domain-containing protein n=1 Tax=Streptomonospora litoralis TaxID=2498135 RepID=A0A4V0ZKF5_9ACTN|nr:Lsr2 family protein [Streptomonospora litoralis]QBI56802.1 hypothetical protein EKD16_25305 [Streptomonospora litoralis]
MSVRFENVRTGRVVEYDEPEDIAPPDAVYPTSNAKAMARRDASRRERLLKAMRSSRRWRTTTKAITRRTELQREHERREEERRRIEAQVRAEYDQKLENERAKWERDHDASDRDKGTTDDGGPQGPVGKSDAQSVGDQPAKATPERAEPSQAEVRAWAKGQGYENVPARGTLPEDIIAAYKAEHPGG